MGDALEEEARRLEEEHFQLCRDSGDPRRAADILAHLRSLAAKGSGVRVAEHLASVLSDAGFAALMRDGPAGELGLAEEYELELRRLAKKWPLSSVSESWRGLVMHLPSGTMRLGLTDKALEWLRELESLCEDASCTAECRRDYAHALQSTIGSTEEPALRTSLMERLAALGCQEPQDPQIQEEVAEGWIGHANELEEEGDHAGLERALTSLLEVLHGGGGERWDGDQVTSLGISLRTWGFGPPLLWPVVELGLRCRSRLLELNPRVHYVRRDLVEALWEAYDAARNEQDARRWDYFERARIVGMSVLAGRDAHRFLAGFMHDAHLHASDAKDRERALEIEKHLRELGRLSPGDAGVQNMVAQMLLNAHWDTHERGQSEVAEAYLEELGRFQARPGASLAQGDQWAKALENAHYFAVKAEDWERGQQLLDRLRCFVDESEPLRRYRHLRLANVVFDNATAAKGRGDSEVYRRDREELIRRCESALCSPYELEILNNLLEDEPSDS